MKLLKTRKRIFYPREPPSNVRRFGISGGSKKNVLRREQEDMQVRLHILPENDQEIWKKDVQRICSCLKELVSYGISEKNVNKWSYSYFQQKKKGLMEIFMKRKVLKKSLSD